MSITRTAEYDAVQYVENPTINPKKYCCEVNIDEIEHLAGTKYVVKCVPIDAEGRLLFHYIELRKRETNQLVINLMPGNWLVRYKSHIFVSVSDFEYRMGLV